MKSEIDFELYYEELEKKVAKPKSKVLTNKKPEVKVDKSLSEKKVTLKQRVTGVVSKVRGRFNNVVNKVKSPRKKAKKLTKDVKKARREQNVRGILGIGLLFVVVSITYSTYVIYNGVSSTASRVMLVPQVVFALLTLFKAFSKIYK
jgi:hypothetical protein